MKNSYVVRDVSFEHLHGVTKQHYHDLFSHLPKKDSLLIGDFFAGYGAVTEHLQLYAQEQQRTIRSILIENNPEQMQRAKSNLREYSVSYFCQDARKVTLDGELFDTIIVKMGIHELSRHEQLQAYKEMYRLLKPGGVLLSWHVQLDEEEQPFFNAITRKKDLLAGYTTMASNRHFFNEHEEYENLSAAGFSDIFRVQAFPLLRNTDRNLSSEFGGEGFKYARRLLRRMGL